MSALAGRLGDGRCGQAVLFIRAQEPLDGDVELVEDIKRRFQVGDDPVIDPVIDGDARDADANGELRIGERRLLGRASGAMWRLR